MVGMVDPIGLLSNGGPGRCVDPSQHFLPPSGSWAVGMATHVGTCVPLIDLTANTAFEALLGPPDDEAAPPSQLGQMHVQQPQPPPEASAETVPLYSRPVTLTPRAPKRPPPETEVTAEKTAARSPSGSPVVEGSGDEDGERQSKLLRMGRSLLHGCRSVERYRKLNRIDEGTYGVVYRARDLETNQVVALKQLKLSATKSEDGFPVPSLREVIILSKLDHVNVVSLLEVVIGSTSLHIFMVMEYAEHELRALQERHTFSVAEVKCLMKQLLKGVSHLHERWVIHRDLKTSNILLTNGGVLKIADFGLARHFGDPLRPYSRNVITMWYRAPELLMGIKQYTAAVDVWSVGCVFAELFLRKPLFPGKSELHQLSLIYELIGVPTEESWPGYDGLPNRKNFSFKLSLPRWRDVFPDPPEGCLSDMGVELLRSLLTCCPEHRTTAEGGIEDPYFWERPYALEPAMMPTYTDTNSTAHTEQRSTVKRASSLVDLKKMGLLSR